MQLPLHVAMIRFFLPVLWLIVPASAETVTSIDPSGPLPEGKTVIWSPLFQATWDEMNAAIGGELEKVEPPNERMATLDSFRWDPAKVMPESGWKAWGGEATKGFLERVNREAAAITGARDGPFDPEVANPGTVACFGLLMREVEFEMEFHRSKEKPLEFRTKVKKDNVKFFGTRGHLSSQYGMSVRVLGHSTDWHALQSTCKDKDDKVVLYLPPEDQDFNTACGILRKLRDNPGDIPGLDPTLNFGDDVRVPYISLDTKADFTSRLAGGRYYGIPGDPWRVASAWQKTKFDLFEKGARVRVETGADAEPFGMPSRPPPPPKPRKFIYDRPFFVFLWREGAEWPYFGVWVGDDSALLKF